MFKVKIFTLYPEFFPGPFDKGIYGNALEKKIWDLNIVNIRDFAEDKHKTVDDSPYGGGSGMVMRADVVANSLDKNLESKEKVYYLSPRGRLLNQEIAKKISKIIYEIYNAKILEKNGILIIHRKSNTNDELIPEYNVIEEKKYGISKIIFGNYLKF